LVKGHVLRDDTPQIEHEANERAAKFTLQSAVGPLPRRTGACQDRHRPGWQSITIDIIASRH